MKEKFKGRLAIDNIEKCSRHLDFARIRCQELIIAIDYQLVNYNHMKIEEIDLKDIKLTLKILTEDIEAAEES
jgi:hypothetical protein